MPIFFLLLFFLFWVSYEIEVGLDSIWSPEVRSSVPTSFINLIKARILSAHPVYLGGIDRKWVGKEIPQHWNFEDWVLWAATAKESEWWIFPVWDLAVHMVWAHHSKCKRSGKGPCQGTRKTRSLAWPSLCAIPQWGKQKEKEEEAAEDQALWVQRVMILGWFFNFILFLSLGHSYLSH